MSLCEEDKLAPSRGCPIGVVLGIIMWIWIIGLLIMGSG